MADGNLSVSAETEKLLADFPNMWDQLQKSLDSKNTDTEKSIEEQFNKIQDGLDPVLKNHAELAKSKVEAEEKAAKLEDRIKDLEIGIAGKGNGDGSDSRKSEAYSNFFEWVKKGDNADIDHKALASELNQKSTLRTDVDFQGGFLLPNVMDADLRKNVTEISAVRAHARQRVMTSKSMEISRRAAGLGDTTQGAPFEGEMEQDESGISKYIQEVVTAYRQSWTVPISKDMLISSAFDIEREMVSDVMEHFALGEGYSFLHGLGVKGPKGMVADTRSEVVPTAAAGVLSFEDFATIAGSLKTGYNPFFLLNRRTLAEVWKLKGTDNHPIWAPVPSGGAAPATIFTYPYDASMIHLDDHTPTVSNTKPIIFGDIARGYEVYDLVGTEVIRDDYTQKRKAIVEYTFNRYLTGQTILPEAIKIMQIA